MTYDRRPTDPVDPAHDHDHAEPDQVGHEHAEHEGEGTRVVERETYVERERPVATGYVPPASSNVNVSGGGGSVATSPGPLYYARRVVSLLFGILAVLIVLRILLLLLVANAGNPIVDFVYSVTEPFVAPFRGIFQIDVVTAGQSALDIGAVVALVGWLLIYLLIMAILRLGDRTAEPV
jgi:YggT family protein